MYIYCFCLAPLVLCLKYLFLQSGTNLDVKPPPVRTQSHPLEGGGSKLAVVHPQGLQAERRTVL